MTAINTSTEVVERLIDGVTPGPWFSNYPPYHTGMVEIVGPSLRCVGFTIATDVDADKSIRIRADARFIAAARDLVPALLKERDEARARAAATFEMAAEIVERRNGEIPERQEIAAAIRALAANQERDALAKVRAEAMREAADWLVILETAAGEADLSERREGIRDAASAIRGRADKIEKGEA